MTSRPILVAPPSISGRHLKDSELEWIDFDPSALAAVTKAAPDVPAEVAERLARCRRAAWQCAAYVRFEEPSATRRFGESIVVEGMDEDFVIDLDDEGNPVGVELLTVALRHDTH